MGPDPMDTSFPVRHREVSAPEVLLEPDEDLLVASAAVFFEALEVMAAQDVIIPRHLSALSQATMSVEQTAGLQGPKSERARKILEVAASAPTLDADPAVTGVEVRIGALTPRPRRTPERLRLAPRSIGMLPRVEDL